MTTFRFCIFPSAVKNWNEIIQQNKNDTKFFIFMNNRVVICFGRSKESNIYLV